MNEQAYLGPSCSHIYYEINFCIWSILYVDSESPDQPAYMFLNMKCISSHGKSLEELFLLSTCVLSFMLTHFKKSYDFS